MREGVCSRGARSYAAVAAIIRPGGGSPEILLVKRAENPADPWSGDWALPGGMMKPDEPSLLQTVVREVREETGVDLVGSAVLIAELDFFSTRAMPWLRVKPFVFKLVRPVEITLSNELTRYAWVGLSSLREGTDKEGKVIYYFGEKELVWGMTARILKTLLRLVRSRELELY